MDYLRRLQCHHCGARSSHSRASKVREFRCKICDAYSYFDQNGEVTDAPWSITSAPTAHQVRFSNSPSPPPSMSQSPSPTFCSTCEHNQRIYLETISNYLPDDDDPRYEEFERALPKFKADLEKRYPQICTKCAPKAQSVIHRADYEAGTRNVGRLCDETQKRKRARRTTGQRDDWFKKVMRTLYTVFSLILHVSLLTQCGWHLYGIFVGKSRMGATYLDTDVANDERLFDITPKGCLQNAFKLQFTKACYLSLAEYVFWSLRFSTALLWYNPGRKAWYHHTYRFGAVTGQSQHFYMQLTLIAVRAVAFWKLADPEVVRDLSVQQFNAVHAFMIVFMIAVQMLANRTIQAVVYRNNFKITPNPEDVDIFAGIAGPAVEKFSPQASSIHPNKLFAQDDPRPFPIWNLATQQQKTTKYPSPPLSQAPWEADYDNGDAMDIDWQSSTQTGMPGAAIDRQYRPNVATLLPPQNQTRSLYNHTSTQPSGWGALRSEIFGLQSDIETENERKRKEEQERMRLQYQPPVEQNPFRGRLPPAPMSMERRLRNPVTQVQFKKAPLSKQQNFMQQMRDGIDNAKTFAVTKNMAERQQNGVRNDNDNEDDDGASVFSFAANRTKGSLDLKKSAWTLPGDGEAATGLEELFGGISFRIDEDPAIEPASTPSTGVNWRALLWVAAPIMVSTMCWFYTPARRAVCLWLVGRLEDFGVA